MTSNLASTITRETAHQDYLSPQNSRGRVKQFMQDLQDNTRSKWSWFSNQGCHATNLNKFAII